ncbi:DoxX protein [Maribacter sp. 2307ULW6-5]|uniref:DoxX protein n=1 Tax=Maribacter sp. 2307ULW6-5 TaxID=3386275 RepID=UPI0039BD54A7
MKTTHVKQIANILFGLVLIVTGIDKLVPFLPWPEMADGANNFIGALFDSGYLWEVIGISEILIGIALVANRLVLFANILLAPLSINILLFHLFLDPAIEVSLPAILLFAYNALTLASLRKQYAAAIFGHSQKRLIEEVVAAQ